MVVKEYLMAMTESAMSPLYLVGAFFEILVRKLLRVVSVVEVIGVCACVHRDLSSRGMYSTCGLDILRLSSGVLEYTDEVDRELDGGREQPLDCTGTVVCRVVGLEMWQVLPRHSHSAACLDYPSNIHMVPSTLPESKFLGPAKK